MTLAVSSHHEEKLEIGFEQRDCLAQPAIVTVAIAFDGSTDGNEASNIPLSAVYPAIYACA